MEPMEKYQERPPVEGEPPEIDTTLLFLDTLAHPSQCFNSEEILFKQPVVLQLIRILKPDSNPHPNLKPFQSTTQVGPVKTFEIFAKNLDAPSDRFEVVLDATTVNENPEMDTLVPFSKRLKTDHLILRGEYEKLSVAIYGQLLPSEEVSLILSKQFDMPQPLKKQEKVSPLLSEQDEQILAEAKKLVEIPEPTLGSMTDVEEMKLDLPRVEETAESMKAKLEAQAKSILNVYDFLVSSPAPSNFCGLFQELIAGAEKLLENLKAAPQQPFEPRSEEKMEEFLPRNLVAICIHGLKGEINSFAEAGLAIRLCKVLAISKVFVHDLITQGLMQSLADIMLQCRSSGLRAKVLDSIKSLLNQEEFLEVMQKQTLTIKNKPEVILLEEKPKEKKSKEKPEGERRKKSKERGREHERKKHKHDKDSKEGGKKSKKHGKSHRKRSKSEEEPEPKKSSPEKKKKVVTNTLGEIIEGNFDVSTLYQLTLSLLMAKQGSVIIRLVKGIIELVEFAEKLNTVKIGAKDVANNKPVLLFCLESIYGSLGESCAATGFLSNGMTCFLNHHYFVGSLLAILEKCMVEESEDNTYIVLSIARIFKLMITTKNGIKFLESSNVESLSKFRLKDLSKKDYKLAGIKAFKSNVGLDQFQLFQMLKNTGRIDREELFKKFRELKLSDQELQLWANQYLLLKTTNEKVPVRHLLIEQICEALNWRIFIRNELLQIVKEKSNSAIAGKLRNISVAVSEKEIVSEAAADVLWGDFPLPLLFASVQEYSPDGLLILLNMLLTLIKQQETERDGFILNVDSIVETIKTTREKLESDEFPSHLTVELKDTVEILLIWLEAYNMIKPTELAEFVKTLWNNLPTASALNIAFHDTNAPNFLKQLFGAAYTLPQNLSPFFLGSSETRGAAVVFFKNAYRCLNNLLEKSPNTLVRLLDAGLLSHVKHILLSLSSCFQQWMLPGMESLRDLSPALAFEDYFELLFQILKLFNKMLPKLIGSAKAYHDPTTVSSLFAIFPHAIDKVQENPTGAQNRLCVAVLKELFEIFASWFKQTNFLEEVFAPKIAELLADLPEKRPAAFYLLTFAAGVLSVKEQGGVKTLQNFMLTDNPFTIPKVEEDKSDSASKKKELDEEDEAERVPFTALLIKKHGSTLGYVLSMLYESHDAKFIGAGIFMLKFLANVLPCEFAERLVEELSNTFSPYISTSHRAGELEFTGTPSSHPSHKLFHGLSKRLLVFRELIPTLCKYAILKSTLPEGLIAMLRSLGNEVNPTKDAAGEEAERLLLENIRSLCTISQDVLCGRGDMQFAPYEVLPSAPQMQKIMGLLSQRAIIDPPTFTGLSNGVLRGPLMIVEYLKTIKVLVQCLVGRSVALFGDHYTVAPTTPKITVCFKELIDQCHELLKLGVPLSSLSPIISVVLDIVLGLTHTFDAEGLKSAPWEGGELPAVIINGAISVMAGDANGMPKVTEKLREFLNEPEIAEKWTKLESIFSLTTRKDLQPPEIQIYKSRPLDQIYQSYFGNPETTFQGKLAALLKPKTVKRAEAIYFIKHKGTSKPVRSTFLGDVIQISCFDKQSDDWIIERLFSLEDMVVLCFADATFMLGDTIVRIGPLVNQLSEPEYLQLEHANLLLSIQTMKRKQREEVEKRRKTRTKPALAAAAKLMPFSPATALQRKPTTQQPSRSISTHVDVFEGLDRGTKNPFPQLQKIPSGKPATPTHIVPTAAPTVSPFVQLPAQPMSQPPTTPTERPVITSAMGGIKSPTAHIGYMPPATATVPPPLPVEEKPAVSSKYQDVINLLNCLSKAESRPPTAYTPTRPAYPHPSMEPMRRPVPSPFVSAPGSLPTQPESAASFQELFARISQAMPEPGIPPARPPVMMRGYTPTSQPTISPITSPMSMSAVQQLTEEEKEVCREIQYLKQQRPNDPRIQERISKLLRQYPRVMPHVMALLKKP